MEIDWSQYKNFTRAEFACRCGCGRADMDPTYLRRLQRVRTFYRHPLRVTSGFRCPEYDRGIGGKGEHTLGKAADFAVMGMRALHLISLLYIFGFRRIGLKQHGPRLQRFLHAGSANTPPYHPALWTYR